MSVRRALILCFALSSLAILSGSAPAQDARRSVHHRHARRHLPTTARTRYQAIRPQTDHEWTIHAVNIQGVFFEKWCQHVMEKNSHWNLRHTNYPLQWRDAEGELDLRAELQIGERLLTLLIECKKNNPKLVD